MKKLLLISLVVLSGCTSPVSQQYRAFAAWESASAAEASTGRVKWSDHYRQAYDKAAAADAAPGRAEVMRTQSVMLDAAVAYESGGITPAQFESLQRLDKAARAQMLEDSMAARSAAQRQAASAALLASAVTLQQRAISYQQPAPAAPLTCVSSAVNGGVTTACR